MPLRCAYGDMAFVEMLVALWVSLRLERLQGMATAPARWLKMAIAPPLSRSPHAQRFPW